MKIYGLIGQRLNHSFSPRYFNEKFEKNRLSAVYRSFELPTEAQLPDFLLQAKKGLAGLNVTIPYKEAVIPLLDHLDSAAEKIGAVNCIQINSSKELVGYNTDYQGFLKPILPFIHQGKIQKALILGTGGASKAVVYALKENGVQPQLVSRKKSRQLGIISYEEINKSDIASYDLIVNTTPLGMSENINEAPALPYEELHPEQIIYDLVYNPERTIFLRRAEQQGTTIINGYQMLVEQAELSWSIWNVEST